MWMAALLRHSLAAPLQNEICKSRDALASQMIKIRAPKP
jgi:hypothetical protein